VAGFLERGSGTAGGKFSSAAAASQVVKQRKIVYGPCALVYINLAHLTGLEL
jgi:hypothetical protein